MSDPMDKATEEAQDPYTCGEFLSSFAMAIAVTIIYFSAAVFLDDQPHGMQIATLTGYSGAIFIFTFRRSIGVLTRYSLRAPYVQRQLPRLLIIHSAYLLALYAVGDWILRMHLQLPGHVESFGLTLIGASQVIFSRARLSRAKAQSAS